MLSIMFVLWFFMFVGSLSAVLIEAALRRDESLRAAYVAAKRLQVEMEIPRAERIRNARQLVRTSVRNAQRRNHTNDTFSAMDLRVGRIEMMRLRMKDSVTAAQGRVVAHGFNF